MDRVWDYDASSAALHDPGGARDFFQLTGSAHGGRAYAPAALCAEMARLTYCTDLDAVSAALRRADFDDPTWFRAKGTDVFLTRSADMAVLAFRGTRSPKVGRLLDSDRVQRLFAGGSDWQEALRKSLANTMPDIRNLFDRFVKESENLVTDFDFLPQAWEPGGRVHRGFAQALSLVWPEIQPHLERVEVPVLYTGHSLGAAMATLAASLRPPEALYTFGSPTVGDAAFAATLDRVVIYRHVNCCDIVCRVPPALYEPIGRLRYIDSGGRITDTQEPAAVKRDARLAHFRKTMGQWDKVWIRDLADHAPVNYVRALLAGQD